jgi:hypothetical protein
VLEELVLQLTSKVFSLNETQRLIKVKERKKEKETA